MGYIICKKRSLINLKPFKRIISKALGLADHYRTDIKDDEDKYLLIILFI